MTLVQRTIARARRRLMLQRMLRAAGVGLLIGCAAAVVVVVLDRTLLEAIDLPWWAALIAVGGCGVIGACLPMLLPSSANDAALRIDRHYQLKDGVTTFAALSAGRVRRQNETQSAFASMLERQAERAVDGLRIGAAIPLNLGWVWPAALAGAALVALGAAFLPPTFLPQDARIAREQARTQALAEQQAVRDSLDEAAAELSALEAALSDEAAVDDAFASARMNDAVRDLRTLTDQLDAQLAGDNADDASLHPQGARNEAASKLSDVAKRLEQEAEQRQRSLDALTERFSGLQSRETPMTAEEFERALRRGDFGEAAQELESMLDRAETPEQREQVADYLHDMADRIEQMSESDDAARDAERETMERALRDAGVPPDAQRAIEDALADDAAADEQALERELREQGVDPELARRMAEEVSELKREEQTERAADRAMESLRDALERGSEEMGEVESTEAVEGTKAQRHEGTEGASAEPGAPGKATEPTQDVDRGQKDAAERTAEEARRPENVDSTNDAQPTTTPLQESQRGAEPQAEDDPSQSADDEAKGEQQDQEENGQQGAEQQPSDGAEAPQQKPLSKPGQTSGQKPGSQPQPRSEPGAGEGAAPDSNAARKPSDAFRDLEKQRKGAEQMREASRKARERARKLADDRTAGERERWDEQRKRETGESREVTEQRSDGPKEGEAPQPKPQADPNAASDAQRPSDQQPGEPRADEARDGREPTPRDGQPSDDDPPRGDIPPPGDQPAPDDEQAPTDSLNGTPRGDAPEPQGGKPLVNPAPPGPGNRDQPQPQPIDDPGDASSSIERVPSRNGTGGSRSSEWGAGSDGATTDPNVAQRTPRESEDVDLTGDEEADRIIAEWLRETTNDSQPARDTSAARSRSTQMRRAQDVAERAVSEQTVPARYHRFIKRYFNRFTAPASAGDASSSSSPASAVPASSASSSIPSPGAAAPGDGA